LKKNGVDELTPASDKCEECWLLYSKCMTFLPWDEACKLNDENESFAKGVAEARAVNQGAPKNFFESAVTHESQVGYRFERHGIIMTAREVKAAFEADLTKASVRNVVPMCEVLSENGLDFEKVAILADPSRPYRTITSYACQGNSNQESRMKHDEMLFSGQGSAVSEFCVRQQQQRVGQHVLSGTLPTMEQLKQKLAARFAKGQASDATVRAGEGSGEETTRRARRKSAQQPLGQGCCLWRRASASSRGKAKAKSMAKAAAQVKQEVQARSNLFLAGLWSWILSSRR